MLRRLVCAEHGFREDEKWGHLTGGTKAIYVKDAWKLLAEGGCKLRQACTMSPDLVWLIIAGSPCQDLTFTGYLNGLLGLTGRRSSLFFVVYIVIYYMQQLTHPSRVRYLVETAGSM